MFDSDVYGAGDAPVWVSGLPYAQFKRVLDPVDGRKFYRRSALGSGAVRPALDVANWSLKGFPKAGAINVVPRIFGSNQPYPFVEGMSKAGGIGDIAVNLPATANTYATILSLAGRGIVDGAFGYLEGLYTGYATSTSEATLRVTIDEKISAEIALPNGGATGSTGQGSYSSFGSLIQFIGGLQFSSGSDGTAFPIGWNVREVPFERLFKVEAKSTSVNRPFHLGIRYALQD